MDRAYIVWVDAFGATRLSWYSYVSGVPSLPYFTALENLANPVPNSAVAGVVQVGTGTPSLSPFAAVADSAVLSFTTAVGNQVGVLVPGFKESLYLADNQTVDPAQPLVIAFIAQALGFAVDGAGNPVTAYIGGLRQKRGY